MNATTTPLTVDTFFGAIVALTTALNRTADNQDRLLLGQQAMLEKVEAPKAPRTPRAGKGTETATPSPAPSPEPDTTSFLPTIAAGDGDALKAHIGPWLNAVAKGTDEAKARLGFLKDLAAHVGVQPADFFGPVAKDATKLKQVLFFFERKKADLDVAFDAAYDFDGDPKQEVEATEDADDGDFG